MTKPVGRPQRAIVIHSPHSGQSEKRDMALSQLRQAGIEITDVISIATLDGLPNQGPSWKKHGIDVAIAAGGDGLVGGVITHIAESGLPLGILPLGTANDIARSIGIPQDISLAIAALAQGKTQAIDIGTAYPAEQTPHPPHASLFQRLLHKEPQQQGYFAHALTIGLNVQFARLATNVATRRQYGNMTYPMAALEVFKSHDALDVELRFEGLAILTSPSVPFDPNSSQPWPPEHAIATKPVTLHCRALQVAVINAPIFGGTWNIALPGATMQDRLLDIVIIEDIDVERLTTSISNLFSMQGHFQPTAPIWPERHAELVGAELTSLPGMYHVQAQGITIATDNDPQDVTLDGELRGKTPITTHIASKQLHVYVPA